MKRSKTEDLSDIARLRVVYQSGEKAGHLKNSVSCICVSKTGVDFLGRPVLMFIGKNFPATSVDLDRVCLFSYCQQSVCSMALCSGCGIFRRLHGSHSQQRLCCSLFPHSDNRRQPARVLNSQSTVQPCRQQVASFANFVSCECHGWSLSRYRRNLKAFYIVHPTFWSKVRSSHHIWAFHALALIVHAISNVPADS